MITTDKYVPNALASLLWRHGVKDVVVSPGSRNAPLIAALARSGRYRMWPVIDERSAAFIALGLSQHEGAPVAVVCTSGSAVLDCAPAVAEAYYRMLPIIVISADRPEELVDQDDSQTIRQRGILSQIVKGNYDLPDDDRRFIRRRIERDINEALAKAVNSRKGPVHINVQLRAPLDGTCEFNPESVSFIEYDCAKYFEGKIELPRVSEILIVAGHHLPSEPLKRLLEKIARFEGVTVVAEPVSNLASENTIPELTELSDASRLLITLGGSIVSASTKKLLRENPPEHHWHIGFTDFSIDTYGVLTRRIEADEVSVPASLDFSGRKIVETKPRQPERPDSAFGRLIDDVPCGWNLQLSNGLSVREIFHCDYLKFKRIDSNRGVSGIEGSTSTAIGLSMADESTVTLLVTGDMSAAYDVGALACRHVTPRFKMAVINNGGGGIFRQVATTKNLPELKEYIDVEPKFPLKQLAEAYGFSYFTENEMEQFIAEKEHPAVLELRDE